MTGGVQPKPKWYQDPDLQPRHPRYWVLLALFAGCLLWIAVEVLREAVGGGLAAGPLWLVGEYYVWQAIVTAATLSGFAPRNRPPNLFRTARIGALIPAFGYLFLSANRAFVAEHSTAVLVGGVWAVANLALPMFAPPRDPSDPYQDKVKV